MKQAYALIGFASLLLGGCTSLSGLSGESDFACKAPPGVTCQSLSGVHANAMAENLPFQRQGQAAHAPGEEDGVATYGDRLGSEKISPKEMAAPMSGMPIRKPPLILRVWVAPYEDEANDLHDQSYFYTMVHPGEWMIESNRSHLRNQFRPVLGPTGGAQARDTEAAGARTRQVPANTYVQPSQPND